MSLVHHAPGQLAVVHFQHVGAGEVDVQARANAIGKEGEAARYQQRGESGGFRGGDQLLAPGLKRSRSVNTCSRWLTVTPLSRATRWRRLSL